MTVDKGLKQMFRCTHSHFCMDLYLRQSYRPSKPYQPSKQQNLAAVCVVHNLWLLIDPVILSRLPGLNFTLLEPESNLLLGILDAVGTMADVASNIDGVVTTDGTWGRGERVGGTEKDTAGLDSITTFPDHGADGSASHILDESREERLLGEILIMLLEVVLASSGQLDGGELEATSLEAGDDRANESTLNSIRLNSNEGLLVGSHIVV